MAGWCVNNRGNVGMNSLSNSFNFAQASVGVRITDQTMECPVFSNAIRLRNPPWVDCQSDTSTRAQILIIDSLDFTTVLQTKLRNLSQAARSPQFNRQVLLAVYECKSVNTQGLCSSDSLNLEPYQGTGISIPRHLLQSTAFKIQQFGNAEWLDGLDAFSDLVAESGDFIFAQLLLLHFFAFLAEQIADYWRLVVREKEALSFIRVLTAFRHQLRCGFLIRFFHRPLRFSRQSIHPIASAT
jgi:hypothetical protein